MLFNRNRVEKDLEKIRNVNLPSKCLSNVDTASGVFKNNNEDELRLEKGDLLAMILAVMSLILPYVIAFVGIMAGIVLLLRYLY